MHRHEESPAEFISHEFPWAYRTAKVALGLIAVGAAGYAINSEVMIDLGFGFGGGLAILAPLVAYAEKDRQD